MSVDLDKLPPQTMRELQDVIDANMEQNPSATDVTVEDLTCLLMDQDWDCDDKWRAWVWLLRLSSMIAELRELRAVVAKHVFRTKDGVPIHRDMMVWHLIPAYEIHPVFNRKIKQTGWEVSTGTPAFGLNLVGLEESYSTREAAQAAKESK